MNVTRWKKEEIMNKCILFTAFYLFTFSAFAQAVSDQKQKSILLMNAYVHQGNGKVIENGAVGIKGGKIILVVEATSARVDKSAFDTSIQLNGAHLYPAFIAPNSTLGLVEMEAVRATSDFAEVGTYNPHIRSLIAFNTDSKILPTVKTNGVLFSQVTPRAGIISGQSSVVALDASNWEDAVLKADDGIHLNFIKLKPRGWWIENQENQKDKNYDKPLYDLHSFFSSAKAYSKAPSVEEKNLRLEAMRGLFDGSKNLYIHCDDAKDILQAVNFAKQYGISKCVIVGGKDSWKVSSFLKKNNVSVMVNRVHDLPEFEQDAIDNPYALPFLLQKDSVLFCLNNAGDMEAMNARNIPFLAGTAKAYGLTEEQAIASVSLNTAKILGIENSMGSIEEGKLASLFVSTGDALDVKTNHVILALINGRLLDLVNSQELLYNKYMIKYNLKK